MLYKEFISALVMTGIITAFAIPMTQLSGESQVVPLLLLTLLCAAPAGAAPAAPATEHAPSSLYDSSSPTMPAGAISVHP